MSVKDSEHGTLSPGVDVVELSPVVSSTVLAPALDDGDSLHSRSNHRPQPRRRSRALQRGDSSTVFLKQVSLTAFDLKDHFASRPTFTHAENLLIETAVEEIPATDDRMSVEQYLDRQFHEVRLTATVMNPEQYQRVVRTQNVTEFHRMLHQIGDIELIHESDFNKFKSFCEVEAFPGLFWRYFLKFLILIGNDRANASRITRTLQFFLFFQTGYEAYLINEVIDSFNSLDFDRLSNALDAAFRNRNVSRIIVRTLRTTWDYFWHTDAMFKHGKYLDSFQQVFFFNGVGFPVSEAFVNTRDFTIASLLRVVLGEGSFITRQLTGRQAIATDDAEVIAQNLAAETTGFELHNRNQHGTFIGRAKTNAFRRQHRLPVDESLLRSFQSTPLTTTLNNGIEHVLLTLARHWKNMLFQTNGNFAHQRMEQLNPFQFLRFQFPTLLVAMAVNRGICRWDSEVLAPFVSKLQLIKSDENMIADTTKVVTQLKDEILVGVCGGIASRVDSMKAFVTELEIAVTTMSREANEIDSLCQKYEIDKILKLASHLFESVDWELPSDKMLRNAILAVCMKEYPRNDISKHAIVRALNLLAPKDKRTLIELCNKQLTHTQAAKLLLARTVTLLQRELRRDNLDERLNSLSKGSEVMVSDPMATFQRGQPYWIVEMTNDGNVDKQDVYIFERYSAETMQYHFYHRLSGANRNLEALAMSGNLKFYQYVNIPEAITVAQWVFMKIELDHGKKFTYSGFMEYHFLRNRLRFLIAVSQLQCYVLDDARLNRLKDIERTFKAMDMDKMVTGETYYVFQNKQYVEFKYKPDEDHTQEMMQKVRNARSMSRHHFSGAVDAPVIVRTPPQSMMVIGGGPTGLLTVIHCLENVLQTNGSMQLQESRDAFTQGGATFERSQIVRLDARWIAMLRYHLGTIYEDVFVPAGGETDSHYGNSLPFQGFIEITIKDLENMMNIQVAKMASRGLLKQDTNSNTQFDYAKNQVIKKGQYLKVGDQIIRNKDAKGDTVERDVAWKVVELVPAKPLAREDLNLGEFYGVFTTAQRRVVLYQLVIIDILTNHLTFHSPNKSEPDLRVHFDDLPPVYPRSIKVHGAAESVVFQCMEKDEDGLHISEAFSYATIAEKNFVLDIGHTHVVSAIGKSHKAEPPPARNEGKGKDKKKHHSDGHESSHILLTTEEPYGVCCLSGLKVSMNMHNFGTRRWTTGIVDDIRSQTDQNTRVVGDFTKIVNTKFIAEHMVKHLETYDWRMHFEKLIVDQGCRPELASGFYILLRSLVKIYKDMAPYTRSHVQTRFFETGDNFYLGMEFTREYDKWKGNSVSALAASLTEPDRIPGLEVDKVEHERTLQRRINALKGVIGHHIDRLWYDATLETIRKGDVYNPGGRGKVPHLYMIDHWEEKNLEELEVGETFLLIESTEKIRYELLEAASTFHNAIVRDFEGHIYRMKRNTKVRIGGNLTRAPDGLMESKVAMSTFPVGHYINYRTIRKSNSHLGYVTAWLGDEQSSPHFMRYSGLTGAAINTMCFDNFIGAAINNQMPFRDRVVQYAASTNWSNGEVVQRGTTSNYGEDGFLRPGFSYMEGYKFFYAKVVEHKETEQPYELFSRDWKIKFAAALIPRGLEHNVIFLEAFAHKVQGTIFDLVVMKMADDEKIDHPDIAALFKARKKAMDMTTPKAAASEGGQEAPPAPTTSVMTFFDWGVFLDGLESDLSEDTLTYIEDEYVDVAQRLEVATVSIIRQAQLLKNTNGRISSHAENQPPSVDALIDDLAAEAQPTTNILVQASTWAAFAQIVSLIERTLIPVSAAFSAIFFWFSLGTITNTSRYKNRNEEWRVFFYDDKFLLTLKTVYKFLSKADRRAVPLDKNPLFQLLERKKNLFVEHIKYYDHPTPNEFLTEYDKLVENLHDLRVIDHFRTKLLSEFIVDTYHVNSYLQADLVSVYEIIEEMYQIEAANDTTIADLAKTLLERLWLFAPRLEMSLQRGKILYGFHRVRAWKHGHVLTFLHYIWTYLWFIAGIFVKRDYTSTWKMKPVMVETWDLIQLMEAIYIHLPVTRNQEFHRMIIEYQSLYFATNESNISSATIVSGYLSFFGGMTFFVGHVCDSVTTQAWATQFAEAGSVYFGAITPITSIVAGWYLIRNFRLILQSIFALEGRKKFVHQCKKKRRVLHQILYIARVTLFLTGLRICATLGAAVLLPMGLAASFGGFPGRTFDLLWLATALITTQIAVNIASFYVEYGLIYDITPNVGELIGVAFDGELKDMKNQLSLPHWNENNVHSEQVHERRAWEYVARAFLRRYRFDAVLGTNRYGSILQYIQSGLQLRTPLQPAEDKAMLGAEHHLNDEGAMHSDEDHVSMNAIYGIAKPSASTMSLSMPAKRISSRARAQDMIRTESKDDSNTVISAMHDKV